MAMQVSIGRQNTEQHRIGHAAASRVVAAIDGLGRLMAWIRERAQNVRLRRAERGRMQLIESLALGNRRQLLLVVCGNQRYLVGAGADCVSSILAVETSAAAAEDADSAKEAAAGSTRSTRKGPELVRHSGRQTSSEPKPGADAWH